MSHIHMNKPEEKRPNKDGKNRIDYKRNKRKHRKSACALPMKSTNFTDYKVQTTVMNKNRGYITQESFSFYYVPGI